MTKDISVNKESFEIFTTDLKCKAMKDAISNRESQKHLCLWYPIYWLYPIHQTYLIQKSDDRN